MPKISFISFADNKYLKTLERITNEAKKSHFFDEVQCLTENNLDEKFMAMHKDFLNSRGFGYWIWKPYLIHQKLITMNDNDILVYCDAGCTINENHKDRFNEYINLLKNTDIVCFDLRFDEKCWTKMDLIISLGSTSEDSSSKQISATCIMFKKNQETINFTEKWYTTGCNYHNIDDSKSKKRNWYKFIEHRHDQSIFSLLVKQYNKKSIVTGNEIDGENINVPIYASRLKF